MLRISQPRIISFVRLLGKLGIFRPLLEYCTLKERIDLSWRQGAVPITDSIARSSRPRIIDKNAPDQIADTAEEGFSFRAEFYSDDFLCLR